MPQTLNVTEQLIVESCPTCHIRYAIPRHLYDKAQARGSSFSVYCPAGHSWHYTGESKADRLERQLEAEKARVARMQASVDQLEADRDHQAARANGYKGALTKAKRRSAHGVCPGCKRQFPDVAAHVAAKHPDLVEEASL